MIEAAGLLQRPDTLLARPSEVPQEGEVQREVGPRGHVRILPEQGGRGGERQRVVESRRLFEVRRRARDLPPGQQADAHAVVRPRLSDDVVLALRQAQQVRPGRIGQLELRAVQVVGGDAAQDVDELGRVVERDGEFARPDEGSAGLPCRVSLRRRERRAQSHLQPELQAVAPGAGREPLEQGQSPLLSCPMASCIAERATACRPASWW